MKTTNAFYRVNPSDICFIRYVFEAHDGIAVITTLSAEKDTIAVRMAPGCEEDVRRIVSGLRNENIMMDERTLEMESIEL